MSLKKIKNRELWKNIKKNTMNLYHDEGFVKQQSNDLKLNISNIKNEGHKIVVRVNQLLNYSIIGLSSVLVVIKDYSMSLFLDLL